MKFVLFIIITQLVNIIEVRKLFTQIGENEQLNRQLFELTDGYTIDFKPVIYGYNAASIMTRANFSFWPTAQYEYFTEGKVRLEKVIEKYPNELELRYIRYAVQKASPSFLGYNKAMEKDKDQIEKRIDEEKWPDKFENQVRALLK